jgi:hypothetical protein
VLAQGGDPLEPHGASLGELQKMDASLWSTGYSVRGFSSRPLVHPPGGMERGSEGSAGRARCWVLRERPLGPLGQDRLQRPPRARDSRDRPYLENCTVDASITYVFAKLVRAHGGCLGTRSR